MPLPARETRIVCHFRPLFTERHEKEVIMLIRHLQKNRLLIALWILLAATMCLAPLLEAGQASGGKEKTVLIGEIETVDADTGSIILTDQAGHKVMLKAPEEIDLKGYQPGDKVTVEYGADQRILNIQ
jgi:hypothetical protein